MGDYSRISSDDLRISRDFSAQQPQATRKSESAESKIAEQALNKQSAEAAQRQEPIRAEILPKSHRMWTLQQKVLSIAAKFFSKAQETLTRKAAEHDKFIKTSLKGRIDTSEKQAAAHKTLTFNDPTKNFTTLPESVFLDTQDVKSKDLGHKKMAETAYEHHGEVQVVGRREVPGLENKLNAYACTAHGLVEGAVTPTSHLLGKEEGLQHLANAYVIMVDGKEHAVIRTAMITTEQYANDFVALMRQVIADIKANNPNKPIRIVSQQLNSPDNENRLVESQHRWIGRANRELQKEPGGVDLVHINMPSNRWYFHTKNVERLGPIGRFLTAIAPGKFLQGERISREQNLDSWSTYVKWTSQEVATLLGEPLGGLAMTLVPELSSNEVEQLKSDIDNSVERIAVLKEQLGEKSLTKEQKTEIREQLKQQSQLLKSYRREMREELEGQYVALKRLENLIPSLPGMDEAMMGSPELKKAMQAISLMQQVLETQLQIPGTDVSRGKEGMLLQLLNDRLGVNAAMNCKSGLDRTGFWHATKLAMVRFEKQEGADLTSLVGDWDKTTEQMNKLEARLNKDGFQLADWSETATDAQWLEKFASILPEGVVVPKKGVTVDDVHDAVLEGQSHKLHEIDHDKLEAFKAQLKAVQTFRQMVLQNLLAVGIPITQISTGVVGFKWNTGFVENLLPLNFIPSHVKLDDGTVVRLVNSGSDGSVKGITTTGRRLLTKFQNSRGS